MKDYALFYFPFLLESLAQLLPPVAGGAAKLWMWILGLGPLLAGAALQYAYLKQFRYKTGQAVNSPSMFVFLSLWASVCSLIWLILPLLAILTFVSHHLPRADHELQFLILLTTVLFLVGLHAGFSALFSNRKQTMRGAISLAAVSIFVVMFIFLLPSYLGGRSLRFLRLGGGIPATVYLKSMTSTPGSSAITGCLILATGSEILLSPQQSGKDCPVATSAWFGLIGQRYHPLKIESYERSDVFKTAIDW